MYTCNLADQAMQVGSAAGKAIKSGAGEGGGGETRPPWANLYLEA